MEQKVILTKKEAKEISLEVWEYLKDHPEISHKDQLPIYLYSRIVHLVGECPLCHIFLKKGRDINGLIGAWVGGEDCPLSGGQECNCYGDICSQGHYKIWISATTQEVRQIAATNIYNMIKKWNIEEKGIIKGDNQMFTYTVEENTENVIKTMTEMKSGEIGVIVEDFLDYKGEVVVRISNTVFSLTSLCSWTMGNTLKVRIFPKGTKVTLEVK